jgi:hypothetical protein
MTQHASDVALEIASMIRSREAGYEVDPVVADDAAGRLLNSTAGTSLDALACITIARRLLNMPTAQDHQVLDGALALIIKASNALEKTTGVRAATFAGHEWH